MSAAALRIQAASHRRDEDVVGMIFHGKDALVFAIAILSAATSTLNDHCGLSLLALMAAS